MNNLKEVDFLSRFPPALAQDEKMLALGRLIAEELHITANEIEKNIIYANIDSLSETWLDVLAYDLHVDWYDYDYPIDAKRAIIKDSVRVHQKVGTKAAVERALGGIHPQSEIEEWFTYGGKPYRFRIVLDTTNSRVTADYDEIVRTVDIYKRLSAHLDGLYYQGSVSVVVMTMAEYFIFNSAMTGKIKTGTEPHRNVEGVVSDIAIVIEPMAEGHKTEAVRTGTKPDRNIVFATKDGYIVTESDTDTYRYISNQTGEEKTGTIPHISTIGAVAEEGVQAEAEVQAYKFESDLTGTNPERNILYESEEVVAVGNTEAEAYTYESTLTGTEPDRAIEHAQEAGAISQTAETESYQYTVKYCGTSGLGK